MTAKKIQLKLKECTQTLKGRKQGTLACENNQTYN